MDFPAGRTSLMDADTYGTTITTMGHQSQAAAYCLLAAISANAGAVWPSANLGIYMPVLIPQTVTVYQMAVEVTTQNGNVDVGIYDEQLTRLTSAGSTAVAAAGLQVFNVADVTLTPGLYYWAMACSSGTAAFRRANPTNSELRSSGVAQQASAMALPSSATFAAVANSYLPVVTAYLSTVTP